MRRTDTDPGWINRRFAKIERRIEEVRAEKRLRGSSFADVPAGAIPTTALAHPNAPGYVYLTTTGFGLGTAGANVISSTVTVPSGFTSCVVSVSGRVFAYNSTAAVDSLYARPVVSGAAGNAVPLPAVVNGAGVNVAPFTTVLTGLTSGATFALQLWGRHRQRSMGRQRRQHRRPVRSPAVVLNDRPPVLLGDAPEGTGSPWLSERAEVGGEPSA